MNENEVKFLVIRFSSIGDIVLTSPIVRSLKNQCDGAVVHFLTKPQYADILRNNPYIDKVHVLGSYSNTIDELKEEGFDYIIDLHKSLRSWRFKNRLKVLDFSFPKINKEKWLMVNFKTNKLPDIHIVDRYFEAVKLFDANNDFEGLDFFIPEADAKTSILPEKRYLSFAIGGQHSTKKLPNDKIIEICSKINSVIVLLGGKEDAENGEIITRASSNPNIINMCGRLNLNQSAFFIKNSELLISHDTGLMHIGAAFKTNIISIWGNTIPEFGMSPYLAGDKSKIFEVDGIKCRPCSKIGFSKCPKKHFDCMKRQNSDAIAEYANSII